MYREHAPPPALASLVECIWTIRSPALLREPQVSRVLPDGCMDVIVDLGDPPPADDALPRRRRSYVVGAMRTPLEVRVAGRVELVGVRFRPGGAAPFVRVPAHELTDGTVALSELWGGAAGELEERLYAADARGRVGIVSELLLRRLEAAPSPHAAVSHACGRIARSGGRVAVAELAADVGLTPRHLERLFAAAVGLSPRMACRVARFRAATARLEREPGVPWTRLALECGFYDQAHMVRDFRALAGVTPTTYRAGLRDVASVQDGAADAA